MKEVSAVAIVARGVIKSFDAGSYQAVVLVEGATQQNVTGVPVNRGLAASAVVVGRRAAVLMFDETNPRDGVVLAVYE